MAETVAGGPISLEETAARAVVELAFARSLAEDARPAEVLVSQAVVDAAREPAGSCSRRSGPSIATASPAG